MASLVRRLSGGAAPWRAELPLAAFVLFSALAVAGFATFGLHPHLLAAFPGAVPAYGLAFTFFPRGHILFAFVVLAIALHRRAGWRWLPSLGVLYAVSLASELLGTTAGVPFGPYRYTDGLGLKWLGHVPVLIPLSWFVMAVPSYALARAAFASRHRVLPRVLLAALILVSWDLSLDPAMSEVTKYWVWGSRGLYYGMPLLNLAGWYATAVALMAALAALRADAWLSRLPGRWAAAFYGANLLLPLGLSAAAGLWGAVGVSAGALGLCWWLARAGQRAPARAAVRRGAMPHRSARDAEAA
jgi:carotene biosynthesis associated membrane protein